MRAAIRRTQACIKVQKTLNNAGEDERFPKTAEHHWLQIQYVRRVVDCSIPQNPCMQLQQD